jgi:hypothetical protein
MWQEEPRILAVHLLRKDDSISIAGNSMIFSAKNPPNNSGNSLPVSFTAKYSGLRMPTKDDSIASNSMIFSAKDPPSNSSNTLPVTFAAKPSGLRMPSPKLGFFDSVSPHSLSQISCIDTFGLMTNVKEHLAANVISPD